MLTLGLCTHVHMCTYTTRMCTPMHVNMHTHAHSMYRYVQKINIKYNFKLNSLVTITVFQVYSGHVELVITILHNKEEFVHHLRKSG